MIDGTFLLLIFFIVCSTAPTRHEVELPPASRGMGVELSTSTINTMTAVEDGPVKVYLGDGSRTTRRPSRKSPRWSQAAGWRCSPGGPPS